MKTAIHFCLIGGDGRQLALRELLRADGHTVTSAALSDAPPKLSEAAGAHCVLLPIPAQTPQGTLFAPLSPGAIPMGAVLSALSPGQHIFAGKVSPKLRTEANAAGLEIRDLLLQEELAVANAVPTAEGALAIAMEHLPVTVHRSRVLIAGFGRVGQRTARVFRALGAEVTVCARSPAQLALAESLDCRPCPLPNPEGPFDLVINTVPWVIFHEEQLARLGSPLLLELASSPGGFDREAVRQLGLRHIAAPGLPGKAAPVTAARAIQRTLYHMLEGTLL